MNLAKDTFDEFYIKYIQIIYKIFLINKTSDTNFGIFSWKFDEEKNSLITTEEIQHKFYLLDHKVNNLKTNCLIFINYAFNKSKKQIKDQIIIDIIYELINLGQEFLNYIVLNKSNYFKFFNTNINEISIKGNPLKSDYYECLIFQYMVLFANILSVNPFQEDLRFNKIK